MVLRHERVMKVYDVSAGNMEHLVWNVGEMGVCVCMCVLYGAVTWRIFG